MASVSGFGFGSVEHFMASAFHDLQKALLFAEQSGAKAMKAEGTVEGITALLPNGSTAVVLERAAFSALGMVLAAANAASAAAVQNGLDLKLDAAAAAAFRSLIESCRSELAVLGYKL